jgi:hypothetical protein
MESFSFSALKATWIPFYLTLKEILVLGNELTHLSFPSPIQSLDEFA